MAAVCAAATLDDAASALRQGDAATALSIYAPLADGGDVVAQNALGVLYRDGLGTERNDAEAVRWFRKSAAQGWAPAQANLGFMLETGRGVARDEREAARYYRLAAERRADDATQAARFSEGLRAYDAGRIAQALEIWRPIAEQGHAGAQYDVGVIYQRGTGVPEDPAEAARWFLMAAYQGDADAQFEVATMYETGNGLPRDLLEARRWYTNTLAAARSRNQASLTEKARERLAALANVKQETLAYDGGRYVIARGADGDCIVAVQGFITRETTRMFDDVIRRSDALGCAPPWLMLESPGGLTADGLALGREVRARKLRTVTRGSCASACSIIFLGGVERVLAGPRARIGFHQPATTRGASRWCGTTLDSNGIREIRSYLRFTIPQTADQVLDKILKTSCDTIDWESGQRALDLGVATKIESAPTVAVAPPASAR
jgi:hypothetical protein